MFQDTTHKYSDNTFHRGFKMSFENGLTVSVQWGSGSYSDNQGGTKWSNSQDSSTAEVAIIAKGHHLLHVIPDMEDVFPRLNAEQVAKVIGYVGSIQSFPEENSQIQDATYEAEHQAKILELVYG